MLKKSLNHMIMYYFYLICFSVLICDAYGKYYEASAYFDESGLIKIKPYVDINASAFGTFNDTLFQTGWGVLNIQAGYGNLNISNSQLMYAAGLLEGRLTAEHMHNNYLNMYDYFLGGKNESVVLQLFDWFGKQKMWADQNVGWYGETDPVWRHAGYVLSQFDGLCKGYELIASKNPKWEKSTMVCHLLNGVGDLLDLMKALFPAQRPDFGNMSKEELHDYVLQSGRCSALVKIMGAFEELFMAHSSWFVYSSTNRIYKHYNFNLRDTQTFTKKMSFSSYPGFLVSLDDFYILESKMVVLQTTNNIFNLSLYDNITPMSLLAWQRMRIANHMANSGKAWKDIFSRYNSGTYNNQYMVVDLKKIELKKEIKNGALWVVEQIPGLVAGSDVSSILRTGYWPSYNVPFFDEIYQLSGYPDFVKNHGIQYSYQLAPRAEIFRRDQDTVLDMKTMMDIMRYNDYEHDNYSNHHPCDTICCRADLSSSKKPVGCYDSKITTYNMASDFKAYAINGPTTSHHLSPFKWVSPFTNMSHAGLPTVYDFGWQYMEPEYF